MNHVRGCGVVLTIRAAKPAEVVVVVGVVDGDRLVRGAAVRVAREPAQGCTLLSVFISIKASFLQEVAPSIPSFNLFFVIMISQNPST